MDEYLALLRTEMPHSLRGERLTGVQVDRSESKPKKKRKASKYNRTYAKEYRVHRARHPRMSHAQITKLAHRSTKKAMK